MVTETFPMWQDDGHLVNLSDVLRRFAYERYRWQVREMCAVARPGSGLNVIELERNALEAPSGIAMSASELMGLADEIEQVIDCEIQGIGVPPTDGESVAPSVGVYALDSTLWTIEFGAPDS